MKFFRRVGLQIGNIWLDFGTFGSGSRISFSSGGVGGGLNCLECFLV